MPLNYRELTFTAVNITGSTREDITSSGCFDTSSPFGLAEVRSADGGRQWRIGLDSNTERMLLQRRLQQWRVVCRLQGMGTKLVANSSNTSYTSSP
jgi:hypothetical protein